MTSSDFIAVDIGAESGRVILGRLQDKNLSLDEIYRFSNEQIVQNKHLHWNTQKLFGEIKTRLAQAVKKGHKKIRGIGVDAWGVDFGLLDKDDTLLEEPYSYRDSRTNGMIERSFELIPRESMYFLTGTQFMQINSVFQLLSMVEASSPLLDRSDTLLFIPDLFHFFMTGKKYSEYTIASTSQLLNASKKSWEPVLFDKLGIPIDIMAPLVQPGSVVGSLLPEIRSETGLNEVDIIAPASHDTASAVVGVPFKDRTSAFLSSGTWSLLGVEVDEPINNEKSLRCLFTNEGGYNSTIRFLRNTMGLWLLQSCLKSWNESGLKYSYDDLVAMGKQAQEFISVIDPDYHEFLNPPDMTKAVTDYCRKTEQKAPGSPGEFVRIIVESLALKYRFIIDHINDVRNEHITALHIVGGGSQNDLLNQFSANSTGLPVIAGPVEAAAAGNITVQAIALGELSGIGEARSIIADSFPVRQYEPGDVDKWDSYYHRVKHLFP